MSPLPCSEGERSSFLLHEQLSVGNCLSCTSGTSWPFPEGVYSLLKAEQEFQVDHEAAPWSFLKKGRWSGSQGQNTQSFGRAEWVWEQYWERHLDCTHTSWDYITSLSWESHSSWILGFTSFTPKRVKIFPHCVPLGKSHSGSQNKMFRPYSH